MFILTVFFRGLKIHIETSDALASTEVQTQTLQSQVSQLQQDKATLTIQATKEAGQSGKWTLDREKKILETILPKQPADRLFTIISKCENGTLDPTRVNWNKNGSFDLGLSQINSVHRADVEAMFGESFEAAMKDGVKNLTYAAKLYHDQGNFSSWVCNALVK